MNNPMAQTEWQSCMEVIGFNSDINLLLNIQKCYHLGDLLQQTNPAKTPDPRLSWILTVNLIVQAVIACHAFLSYNKDTHELDQTKQMIIGCEKVITSIEERGCQQAQSIRALQLQVHSDIKNIMGRLNKGGDIRRDIETLKHTYYEWNQDLNQFKLDFYSRTGRDCLLVPPSSPTLRPSRPSLARNNQLHRQCATQTAISTEQGLVTNPTDGVNSDENDSPTGLAGGESDPLQKTPMGTTGIRYKDISKINPTSDKPYKRVFVPNRGWISLKQLQTEEKAYGPEGIIKHQKDLKVIQ